MAKLILGIDEAGRGAVIGPLVIAGAMIDEDKLKEIIKLGVRDSKKHTPLQRADLYHRIRSKVKSRIIKISAEEIDANNEELKINELFCSHYLFKSKILSNYLLRLKEDPKTKEIYFTDILNKMIIDNKNINSMIISDWKKLVGLNTKEDLEWAESQKMI